METQVPSSLRSFLKAFKQTLGHIFSLAKDIKAYSESGTIDPEFKQYLDLATGFSEDTSLGKPTQESSLATTPETLSIGRKGTSREGKTKGDRDQFGPKLSEDMSSKENFERATNALSWATRKKKDAIGVAYRKELGRIDIPWGRSGHHFPIEKNDSKGDPFHITHTDGYGLSHIIEKHGIEAALSIPKILSQGTVKKSHSELKWHITLDDKILILVKTNMNSTFGITAFDNSGHAPQSLKQVRPEPPLQPSSKVRAKRIDRSLKREHKNK